MPDPEIDPQQFREFCGQHQLCCEPEQAGLLRLYLELLLKWNRKINLTARTHWQSAMLELIADSFHLNQFIRGSALFPPGRPDTACTGSAPARPVCWDLGAGAGLPGIPLRVLWPEGTYHLVELREKRALFLQTVLARLKLERTRVCRLDAAAFMRRELERGRPADLILSRAFMPWPELLGYVRPYLPASGVLLLMLNGADFELNRPDWKLLGQQSYSSPGGPRRFVALAPLLP